MNHEENRMNLVSRLKELSGAAVIALLLGSSMSLTVLDALALAFPVWQVALVNAVVVLMCMVMLLGRIPALIATVGVAIGAAVPIARNISIVQVLKETLVSFLTILVGGEGSLNEHALVLIIVVSVIMALLSFLLTRLTGGVYPALLLFSFVMLGGWYMEKRLILAYTVPGLMALAVLYARAYREGMNYIKAVPAALAAVMLAVVLTPAGEVTWQPLENAAEKVRELFSDYFLFTDPRTVYSISSDGYQPMGETLGGPANPREADVMTVKTDRLLLLRGSVRRTYTGYSWVDNSMNSRYLFIDPTRQALRDGVFDVDMAAALGDAVEEVDVSVHMLNPGTSTLFVPHRLQSLSTGIDLVPYYNDSGEVFITRSVEPDDRYELTAGMLAADADRMRALTALTAAGSDPDYEKALHSYMNLPAGLDNEVYWLTQRLIENAQTPYDKALAIQAHLLSSEYTYNLNVDYPPAGRDFVSHFLLDSKEGYCTYYASAMAVMARLAGLPSRYIEGYLVPADPDGETLVTGENAHAWVEIYFEGIGWISFDATPGDRHGENGSGGGNAEPSQEPTATPQPTPSPTPDHGGADTEDEPDQPEITPTPEPDENMPDADEPTPTPEPEQPQPSEQPEDDPQSQDRNEWLKGLMLILGILLLALLIAYFLRRRYLSTSPMHLAGRQKADAMRLMVWYRSILTLLMRSGFAPEGGETPERFAQRLVEANAAPDAMIELARMVAWQQYARPSDNNGAVRLAQQVYGELIRRMKPFERFRWLTYRMARGLGSFHQIP